MNKFYKNKYRQLLIHQHGYAGQAMVLMVLILGSIMLGATTVAGYITVQKIRTVSDIVDSTKAIYAADSGIEECFNTKFGKNGSSTTPCNFDVKTLYNGATVEVKENGDVVKSVGHSGRSWRAFGIFLGEFNN